MCITLKFIFIGGREEEVFPFSNPSMQRFSGLGEKMFLIIFPQQGRDICSTTSVFVLAGLSIKMILLFHLTLQYAPCHASDLLRYKYVIIPYVVGLMKLPFLSCLDCQPFAYSRVLSPQANVHMSSRGPGYCEASWEPCKNPSVSSLVMFRTGISWEGNVSANSMREI